MTNSAPLIAYHGDPEVKAAILAQLKRHRAADEIVKGQYWCDGKGCAVGCTIYSGHHAEFDPLAYLQAVFFHLLVALAASVKMAPPITQAEREAMAQAAAAAEVAAKRKAAALKAAAKRKPILSLVRKA